MMDYGGSFGKWKENDRPKPSPKPTIRKESIMFATDGALGKSESRRKSSPEKGMLAWVTVEKLEAGNCDCGCSLFYIQRRASNRDVDECSIRIECSNCEAEYTL